MPLLEVRHLVKEFSRSRGLFARPSVVRAVDDVSFTIDEGETFGLVGESGSGKTTTGRCILRLIEPDSGEVRFTGRGRAGVFEGAAAPGPPRHADRLPGSVLVAQPAHAGRRHRRGAAHHPPHRRPARRGGRASPSCSSWSASIASQLARYPHQFSGGQRQRIGLARALALNPSLIIADEPVSALDVSVQAQVVNLLMELQERLKLTYLFIAHDLRLVRHICSRVAVMYLGRIVEMGTTEALFAAPAHPYTQALLSAIPLPDPSAARHRVVLDPASFDHHAPLREVAAGHFAAL